MTASNVSSARPVSVAGRLTRLACYGIVGYLGVTMVLLFLENKLLFHPVKASQAWLPPPPDVEEVELEGAGERIHGWWFPRDTAASALLYCHGNAGNLSYRGQMARALAQELGVALFLFDYPGYGKSSGKPTEAGCYAAADAAFDWLVAQGYPPEHVILYGKSLGGGVASHLAVRRPHRALVLVKSFTSIPDVAAELYPFLPARWLVRNQFDNLRRLPRCRRPVFIAHGDCDRLIPCAHGQRLFEAANPPKSFLLMPGVDHADPPTPDFFPELRHFLETHAPLPEPNAAIRGS